MALVFAWSSIYFVLLYVTLVSSFTPHLLLKLKSKRNNNVLHSTTPSTGVGKEVIVLNADTNTSISIPAGSPLSLAAIRSGIRLSFQCKQGSCSSCETLLNGKRTRTCITKVPDMKKITLKKAPKL